MIDIMARGDFEQRAQMLQPMMQMQQQGGPGGERGEVRPECDK